MWGTGIVASEGWTVGQLLGLDNDDVLIAWHEGFNIFIGRYTSKGTAVWKVPASIATQSGPNKRIFGLVSDGADGADGAFILWDEPVSYVRTIWAARVTMNGVSTWNAPLAVTLPPFGSSRHTDPCAIADGNGGVIVVWTRGAESAETIAPLLVQRISRVGLLEYGPEGRLVSLVNTRQFDPMLAQHSTTGDTFIVWRDGVQQQTARAQRMTLAGERVWGDGGVLVSSLVTLSHFDTLWIADELAIAVATHPGGEASVQVHRLNESGNLAANAWPVSGVVQAGTVHVAPLGEAMAITWLQDEPSFPDSVVAQRLNADGTLGLPTAPGDVNDDGHVNVGDLLAVIMQWGPCSAPPALCPPDVAPLPNGDGVVNVNDLLLVIVNWD